MPNWCECDLTIEGKRPRVEEFLRFAAGPESPFDFNRFIPYPEKFAVLDRIAAEWDRSHPDPKDWRDRQKDGYNRGGYEWRCKHWATKWNALRVQVGEISSYAEAAWV